MRKILLVEDNDDVRENTAEILELAGYQVISASEGKAGVEMARIHKPDLIICDIMMPGLDGYGVLHLLSKDAILHSVPFIFLTAKAERSDMRKGMEMGADDYITKPFDKIELLNAVESRLRKSENLRKDFQEMKGLNEFISEVAGENALKKFMEGRKQNHYRKKDNIYNEGNYPNGLYYIQSGKVKIIKSHTYGKELITDLLKAGDFFGYTSLLEELPYNESAQVLEDAEILFIPKDEVNNFIYGNPAVTRAFIRILTRGVIEKQERLVDIAYSSVRKRASEALIMLEEKYRQSDKDAVSFSFSREDLANMVGTATESLIRTLSDFKEEKLIEIKEGKIHILQREKLRNLKS